MKILSVPKVYLGGPFYYKSISTLYIVLTFFLLKLNKKVHKNIFHFKQRNGVKKYCDKIKK